MSSVRSLRLLSPNQSMVGLAQRNPTRVCTKPCQITPKGLIRPTIYRKFGPTYATTNSGSIGTHTAQCAALIAPYTGSKVYCEGCRNNGMAFTIDSIRKPGTSATNTEERMIFLLPSVNLMIC